jgi:hypothetical protein
VFCLSLNLRFVVVRLYNLVPCCSIILFHPCCRCLSVHISGWTSSVVSTGCTSAFSVLIEFLKPVPFTECLIPSIGEGWHVLDPQLLYKSPSLLSNCINREFNQLMLFLQNKVNKSLLKINICNDTCSFDCQISD